MPPNPAIAAEIANTPSFTRSTETPDVLAAISDERVAAIARPHVERLRLRITSAAMPTSISMNIANVLLLFMSNGPMTGRGIAQPDCMLRNQFHWNRTWSPRNASASVASASGKPPNRSAGSATTTPSNTVTPTPTRIAGRKLHSYRLTSMPVVSAAASTNVPWARLTIPPRPVTTTNDRKISDSVSPVAITPTQKSFASTSTYTIRNATAIVHGRARRHKGRSAR